MNIEALSQNDLELSFIIKKTDPAFVNTIRRLVIDEVPTMAVEDIEVRKNDSALYDEFIAHRIGLIPLKTDLKGYSLPKDGLRDARSEVELTLKVLGPCTVLSGKMKSKDPAIVPVFDKIPITKLLDGQEIEMIAKAVGGKGKDHAKFSPGIASFKQRPSIVVSKKADATRLGNKLKGCGLDAVTVKDGNINVDDKKLLLTPTVDIYEDISPEDISVNYATDEFVFDLESWGQLAPKEIIDRACEELELKLDELKSLL